VIRTRKGTLSAALQAFQRALVEDPSFEPAKANLARAEQLAALDRASS